MKTISYQKYIVDRIDINPNGCWIWKSKPNKYGYAQANIEGKHWRVHRLSYILVKGDIPKGLVIDHLCRVRNCVNPQHLQAVSQKENLERGYTSYKKNRDKTRCKNGHKFTKTNTYTYKGVNGSVWRRCKMCERIRQRKVH